MGNYSNEIFKATTSTTVGIASLECPGSGMRRFKLCELIVGSDAATLGTSNFKFQVQRATSTATGTTIVLDPSDPADAVAVTILKNNLTADGTVTAAKIPLTIPLNQQATFRWVANPGKEIVVPASANNGLHIRTPVSGNTPAAAGTVWIEEQ